MIVGADQAAAVSVPVGAEGGTISVEGMSLAIPAGAVAEGTTITATPLRSLQGSPFAAAPVGLKLEPSGLVLLRPATLTLPRPSGTGTVVGFGFDGNGEELHLVPATVSGDTVQLKVWHFSGAGTLTARLSELNAVLSYQTTRAHGRAEQRIAAALIDAATNGSDPGQAIFDALIGWRTSVSNGLQVAWDSGRLDFFELAFGEWQAWQAYVQEYRDSVTPTQARTFDIFIRFDTTLATAGAYDVGLNVLARCVGPGVPRSALRDVLRLATAVVMAALPIDQANDPNERQLPDGDGLARACLDVELLAFEHAPTFARNRDNHFTARARVIFWNGPASTTVPLRYRLRDATAGPTPSLASGTSATGSYEDNLTPTVLGLRHYELTIDLDTSGSDAVLASFFDRETDVVPVRERLDLQARRPSDAAFADSVGAVGPGGTVLLRIRLAGDDIAGKTITLTHDGSGTLPASATTDAVGEATIIYTAPAAQQIELVNGHDHRWRLHERRRRRHHHPPAGHRHRHALLRLRRRGPDAPVHGDRRRNDRPPRRLERRAAARSAPPASSRPAHCGLVQRVGDQRLRSLGHRNRVRPGLGSHGRHRGVPRQRHRLPGELPVQPHELRRRRHRLRLVRRPGQFLGTQRRGCTLPDRDRRHAERRSVHGEDHLMRVRTDGDAGRCAHHRVDRRRNALLQRLRRLRPRRVAGARRDLHRHEFVP